MKSILLCFLCLFVSLESKPFVVGRLKGQLGNQMFEIATTLSLAWDNDAEAYFPDLTQSDKFNIPNNFEKVFFRLNGGAPPGKIHKIYLEKGHPYKPIPFSDGMAISGFFQTAKYFDHHRDRIVALFQPVREIDDYLLKKYAPIIDHPKTVALHARTYFREDPSRHCFHLCDMKYFKQAMDLFPDEDTVFIIFSDEIWWCEFIFRNCGRQMIFMKDEDYLHDFYLMSKCKHHIISNSSFSWWAAYLNQNPDKTVVAPAKWMVNRRLNDCDIVPDEWIKVDW